MEQYNNNYRNNGQRNNYANNNMGQQPKVNNENECTVARKASIWAKPVQVVSDNKAKSAAAAAGAVVAGFAIYKIATRGWNPRKWFGKKEANGATATPQGEAAEHKEEGK